MSCSWRAGVVVGNVEGTEVVPVGFDVRAFGNGEPEIGENLHHLFPDLGDRVDGAGGFGTNRKSDVDELGGQAGFELGFLQLSLTRCDGLGDCGLESVEGLAGGLALFGVHFAEGLHALGDDALFAQR